MHRTTRYRALALSAVATLALCNAPALAAPPANEPLLDKPVGASPNKLPKPCRIKGNISEAGHIYHVPGSAHYSRTRVEPEKGERWFCTEEEAIAAGWRAPK
jgi:hypothetical protein